MAKKEETFHKLENYVVSVDLGATEFRGIIGKEDKDGKIEIVAYDSVVGKGIKRGCIQNISDVSFQINKLCTNLQNRLDKIKNTEKKLEDTIKTQITKVYVSLNGCSIETKSHNIRRVMGGDTVTKELMEDFIQENKKVGIDRDSEFLDIIQQECSIDDEDTYDNVIGTRCDVINAKYKLIIGKESLRRNITDSLKDSNRNLAGTFVSPIAVSDTAVGKNEKELGCMVVDFGDTSTGVSIYWKGYMRFAFVIPLGCSLITKDLCELKLTEIEANSLKNALPCMPLDNDIEISLDENRHVMANTAIGIISSRIEQILDYVNACVEESHLRLGSQLDSMVMIGRGSTMKGLKEKAENHTGLRTRIGTLNKEKFAENKELGEIQNEYLRFAPALGTLIQAVKNQEVEDSCIEYKYQVERNKWSKFEALRNIFNSELPK